jgi:rhodanese-related sulfurtransferase
VTPSDLFDRIQAGKAPIVLDVRSEREFSAGHVPGAVHVPFWAVVGGAEVPGQHDDLMVVYCALGPRAYLAGAALRARGFQRIEYLDGHMTRWMREGLPQST